MFLLTRRPLRSSERILENNRRLAYRAGAGVFFVLVFLSLAVWVSRREEITITKVKITGAASVSEKEVRAFVDEALSGAYGGLFPRRNSFIYPKEAVARGLFENFPHIASASVSRGSFQELFINIQERPPAYLWCGDA